MKTLLGVFLLAVSSARAEDTQTTIITRLAMRNAATQHYFQVYQTRGKWVGPDILYVDFGKGNYRETLAGAGRIWYSGQPKPKWPKLGLAQVNYVVQTTGPASHGAMYFLPWTKLDYKFSERLSGNTVYFFYAPLNQAGKFHQSLERAKLEYSFCKTFKAGAGYGGSKASGKPWQNKPMLTATVKCGALGDVEFWLQRLPGNHGQGWLRLVKTFK